MRIEYIEISNFRRLLSTHIDIASENTLLVGANNSGKTSAMVALRIFLKGKGGLSTIDITASNWKKIESIAATWSTDEAPDPERLNILLPAVDVWISIEDSELYHVAHLIPTLDWAGGLLGVRLRLEAKSFDDLRENYLQARSNAKKRNNPDGSRNEETSNGFSLWPKSFKDYLEQKFKSSLTIRAYILDPGKFKLPEPLAKPPNSVIF